MSADDKLLSFCYSENRGHSYPGAKRGPKPKKLKEQQVNHRVDFIVLVDRGTVKTRELRSR